MRKTTAVRGALAAGAVFAGVFLASLLRGRAAAPDTVAMSTPGSGDSSEASGASIRTSEAVGDAAIDPTHASPLAVDRSGGPGAPPAPSSSSTEGRSGPMAERRGANDGGASWLASPTADETTLMAELRRARDSDPARAIELAREGNRRFTDSPDAPERSSILVHALASEGRGSEARGEAEDMVNRYPDSDWIREAEQFTGAHRHRNLRLRVDGSLEYY